jgi:hypothetical protein
VNSSHPSFPVPRAQGKAARSEIARATGSLRFSRRRGPVHPLGPVLPRVPLGFLEKRPQQRREFAAPHRRHFQPVEILEHERLHATPFHPPTLGFIVNAIPGYPYLPTNGRREAADDSSSWDGRLIGRYVFSPTLNAYAGVARGHRPRSLIVDSTSTVGVCEESVVNYEAGLKGSLAQGKLQWSASVYHYDYEHFQTTVLSLGRFTVEDAGNATGRGFEFGLQGRVSGNVSMFANYAYTDATFDDTDDSGRRQQYAG